MTDARARAVLKAVYFIGSYAIFYLGWGLLFRQPYHPNALWLGIGMLVLVSRLMPIAPWWVALPACVALALLDAVLAWSVGQAIGLDEPASLTRLLGHGLAYGALAGSFYTIWMWRRQRSAGHRSDGRAA